MGKKRNDNLFSKENNWTLFNNLKYIKDKFEEYKKSKARVRNRVVSSARAGMDAEVSENYNFLI